MNIHIGSLIRDEMKRQDRTAAWLARQICCTRTNVYKIFEKDNIDIKLLHTISKTLNHDFFHDISTGSQNEDTSVKNTDT